MIRFSGKKQNRDDFKKKKNDAEWMKKIELNE